MIQVNAVLPVTLYGGTERVMWYLGKELASMGHKVCFLCRPGSHSSFAEITTTTDPYAYLETNALHRFDIVHFNNGVPPNFQKKPYVVTFHGNNVPETLPKNSIFVSQNHAKRFGSSSYVYNGLDWSDYSYENLNRPRTHFHFLGNAAWRVKNVKGAIRIARAADKGKIMILGGHRLNFKMGFRFTLSPKANFCGMVGGDEKLRLLYSSKGLIFPVKWDEPFGLAVTESLFCGAPVFASQRGSLPELVIPEVGFLSNDESSLATHIAEFANSYSPIRCREYAADNFNSRIMALNYLKKYEEALNASEG